MGMLGLRSASKSSELDTNRSQLLRQVRLGCAAHGWHRGRLRPLPQSHREITRVCLYFLPFTHSRWLRSPEFAHAHLVLLYSVARRAALWRLTLHSAGAQRLTWRELDT